MQNGQLGTEQQHRMIFIWEGAVAFLPDLFAVQTMEHYKRRLHLWDQALEYWQIHRRSLNFMWSVLARTDLRIDLCVTTREPGFAKTVARRCERENWPVRYVFAQRAPDLGRQLASMPDVDRVYYGLEEQQFCYGSHGHFVSPDVPMSVA